MSRASIGWICLLALVCCFVVASPALAAHDEHEGGEEVNPFKGMLDLGIWTIVVFLVLLVVLGKFAWGPMMEGLQKREHNIQEALREAERGQLEAEQLRGQLQREMDQAADKVHGILDLARRDAQKMTDDMVGKARTEIQSERERLHREIDTARDQALQALWNQTAQLATLISSKTIRRQLNADDHRRLMDEAVAELGTAGAAWQKQSASLRS